MRKSSPPIAPALANELMFGYLAGASIRELAKSKGLSYGGVHGVLDRLGVDFRARGGDQRWRKRQAEDEP